MNFAWCLLLLIAVCHGSLVIKKTWGLDKGSSVPTVGKDLVVTLQVYNLGESPLYEVEFMDKYPKDQFVVTSGLSSAKWLELPAGANLTHTYSVQPIRAGEIALTASAFIYKDAKGLYRVAHSNSNYGGERFMVVLWSEADQRAGAHLREWVVFSFLSLLLVATPGGYYYFITKNYHEGLPKTKQD